MTVRMTTAAYKRLLGGKAGKSKSKYRNVKTVDAAGNKFDSKMEAEYHKLLLMRERAGEIMTLQLQPKYTLQEKQPGMRAITYVADFVFIEIATGQRVVVDVKGAITQAFAMKRKMFLARYPDLRLMVVTKRGGRWVDMDEAQKAERARKKAVKAFEKKWASGS